jgi:hypothetical protein
MVQAAAKVTTATSTGASNRTRPIVISLDVDPLATPRPVRFTGSLNASNDSVNSLLVNFRTRPDRSVACEGRAVGPTRRREFDLGLIGLAEFLPALVIVGLCARSKCQPSSAMTDVWRSPAPHH